MLPSPPLRYPLCRARSLQPLSICPRKKEPAGRQRSQAAGESLTWFEPAPYTAKVSRTGDIPELTDEQFARAIPARLRKRLMEGQVESGEDIAALRRFVGLSQVQFALAMSISVHTLRNCHSLSS